MSTDPSLFRDLPGDDPTPLHDPDGHVVDEHDDLSPQGAEGRRSFREAARVPLLTLVGLVALLILGLALRGDELRAAGTDDTPDAAAAADAVVPFSPDDPYTFSGLDIHPDRLYGQYFAGAFAGAAVISDSTQQHLKDFLWRLEMYRTAYGVDDNFSIRVLDDRTGETLEIRQLRDLRDRFRSTTGQIGWDEANRARRTATTELRNKWKAYGIPEDNIVIRWGYADQTQEARDRDARTLTYEVNLARRLGLSVLATEIGTVETFNQDALVSSAGARSRYQMMPDIMRMFDVEQYALPVASGGTVQVREELHPLLSMEPSMMLVRAYANSVGHELPGISAYHTGPGNIFKMYREYLRANPGRARGQHVSDAYMWGVTDGFERVDAISSFGPHSRAYVLKAYGSLRATEDQLIDPAATLRAERVQIKPGATARLSQILTALEPHARRLDWGPAIGDTPYERFRDLNEHIALPAAPGGGVPASGDLRLSARASDEPVRFFLPVGATEVLRAVGLDVIGSVETFDERTHLLDPSEITPTDRAYARLVADAGRFGFTRSAQRRMDRIHDDLQTLAANNPDSRYRQTQAAVARIHRSVWRTAAFRELVATTEALLSVDPRVNIGRQPAVTDADTAPAPRPRESIRPLPAKPPRVEDTINY
ncbi:hypothetical protein [Rubrivirga sp. IMCC43871]|uniref:hypothetical protein n=1 Tax=Rubrivirga sp. IMCC43871 TaxID=3391575 RepID=UPI00398F9030